MPELPTAPIPPPAADPGVDRVADSPLFRKAPVLRDLLLYLWRHRGTAVSEYAIGTEVLGRKPDFDPKTDSAVRVHISRLRARLKDYYESPAGAADTLRLHIPPGEYRLDFQTVTPQAARPFRNPWRAACAAAGVVALLLAADNYRLRIAPPTPTALPPIETFWTPIAQKGRPISIIVPAPLFFRWEKDAFVARDFRVNRPEDLPRSLLLNQLFKDRGPAVVSHLYTVASDTVAASSVSRYLEDRGVPARIVDTPAVTLDLLDSQDAIVFVGPGSTHQVANVMDRLGYAFDRSSQATSRGWTDLRTPATYPVTVHSPSRTTGHGVIALVPGKSPRTRLLVVASSFNPALASLLTNGTELGLLNEFLRQQQTGPFFEAMIRYEVNSDRVLDARPVAARTLKP